MQTYIGVKMIQAEPAEKEGSAGYNITYPDGYVSWSPKDVFEAAYLPIKVNNSLTQDDISQLVAGAMVQDIDPKTALMKIELTTGFVLYETASCVSEENYDQKIGASICDKRINDKVWFAMGFVLQWARFGLKHVAKIQPQQPEGA